MDPNELSTSSEEQGASESIEDIASLLADANAEETEQEQAEQGDAPQQAEEADDAEQEQAEAAPEDPEFEWDAGDQKLKVKLSELKSGYMKDADYRRKTAQTAELTRAAEQERQQIRQEREQGVNQLNTLATALYQELVGDKAQLAQLLDDDPVAYLRVKQQMEHKQELLQQVAKSLTDLTQAQEADRQAEFGRFAKREREALQEKLPEWRDKKVRDQETVAIAQYLTDMGYSKEDLESLHDHRAMLIARDAMRFRLQQKLKAQQAKKDPPKPIKSGTAQVSNQAALAAKAADDRLRKSPDSLEALAGALGARGI